MDAQNAADTTRPVSLLERHHMVVTRLRAGSLCLKEYRLEFARFLEQKEAVYKEIDARICETLMQRWGLKWPERAVQERSALTHATFLGLLYDYLLVRTDPKTHATFGDDVMEYNTDAFSLLAGATTAQDLADYAKLIREMPRKRMGHPQGERPRVGAQTQCGIKTARHQGDEALRPVRRKRLLRR
jgi:hypothetical protein